RDRARTRQVSPFPYRRVASAFQHANIYPAWPSGKVTRRFSRKIWGRDRGSRWRKSSEVLLQGWIRFSHRSFVSGNAIEIRQDVAGSRGRIGRGSARGDRSRERRL